MILSYRLSKLVKMSVTLISEQLQARSAELAATKTQAEKLTATVAERDSTLQTRTNELTSTTAEAKKHTEEIERLQLENQELLYRQHRMNEEMVKVEGQISLIKNLLLREQGL